MLDQKPTREELLALLREIRRYLVTMIEAKIIARPCDLMTQIDRAVSGVTSVRITAENRGE